MTKRDARTQPLATQPMPPRQPARVTEPLPQKEEQARPASITEPHLTQPLTAATYITEPALTVPALTVPANTVQVRTGAAFAGDEEPSTATELVSQPLDLTEPAIAEELSAAMEATELPQPVDASLEAPAIREPFDSEPLRQLEKLSAQIEQELRKSNPNYRPVPVPPQSDEPAAEEPLELYLERFMERVTGKKLDAPPAQAAPSAVSVQPGHQISPAADKSAQPSPESAAQPALASPAAPPRPPECREQLAAMRDLANERTRSAFAEYAGRKHWQQARLTFLAAGAASLVSSVYAVWHLTSAAPGAIQGSVCAGLIAALLAFRFFLRFRQLTATTGKA